MPYQRKTQDEYRIQQYTGELYKWEDVTAEDSRRAGLDQLRTYRENDPSSSYRMIKRRVRLSPQELEEQAARQAAELEQYRIRYAQQAAITGQNIPIVLSAWRAIDDTAAGEQYRAAMREHDLKQTRATRRRWKDEALNMEHKVFCYLEEQARINGLGVLDFIAIHAAASVAQAGGPFELRTDRQMLIESTLERMNRHYGSGEITRVEHTATGGTVHTKRQYGSACYSFRLLENDRITFRGKTRKLGYTIR